MWRQLSDDALRADGLDVRDVGRPGSDSGSSMGAGSMIGQTDMGTMTWVPLHEGSQVEKVAEITPLSAEGSYVRVTFVGRRQQLSELASARGIGETYSGT